MTTVLQEELQIEVIWIRHGLTRSNELHRYLGRTDEGLSEEGIRQLGIFQKQAEQLLEGCACIAASPMKRCLQTAELLSGRAADLVIPEWEEMDFGDFEGKSYLELKDQPEYQRWIDSNGTLPFPKGESREQFIARCMKGFYRLVSAAADFGLQTGSMSVTSAAVVHGGTIMAVLSTLTEKEYFDFQVKNGSGYVTRLRIRNGQPELTGIKEIE